MATLIDVGLRDLGKRLRATVAELDGQRLQDRFVGLDLTPLSAMTCRTPVRVGGEITRMRLAPRSGVPAVEITVTDGTGSVVAVFTGRRHLGGIEHDRAIVLEGVACKEHGRRTFMNPAYTLLP